MNIRLFFALLCLSAALCLCACAQRPVRVAQEARFKSMCLRLKPEMTSRALLDEQGNYLENHLKPLSGDEYGRILFERLSPSFRYGDADPMVAPKSFAESVASPKDAQIRDKGFTLTQGLDTVEVELLAAADWNGDGKNSWLISCRVNYGSAPRSRVYYAAVADPETEGMLRASALGVYECETFDCAFRSAGSFAPESPVIESLPGRRTITSPPTGGAQAPAPRARQGRLFRP